MRRVLALSAGFRAVPQKSYKAVGVAVRRCECLRMACKWLRSAPNDLRTRSERPANEPRTTCERLRTACERPANDLRTTANDPEVAANWPANCCEMLLTAANCENPRIQESKDPRIQESKLRKCVVDSFVTKWRSGEIKNGGKKGTHCRRCR